MLPACQGRSETFGVYMPAKGGVVGAADGFRPAGYRPSLTAVRPDLSKLDAGFAAAAGKTALLASIAHLNFSTTYKSERIREIV